MTIGKGVGCLITSAPFWGIDSGQLFSLQNQKWQLFKKRREWGNAKSDGVVYQYSIIRENRGKILGDFISVFLN